MHCPGSYSWELVQGDLKSPGDQAWCMESSLALQHRDKPGPTRQHHELSGPLERAELTPTVTSVFSDLWVPGHPCTLALCLTFLSLKLSELLCRRT